MDLQNVISDRRKVLKISQQDLAEMSGVGLATIKSIECGKANPSIATLEKLLFVLGMELEIRVRQTY